MKRSQSRILTTHVGSLPRPADLLAMMADGSTGRPRDGEAFASRARSAVADVVRRQALQGLPDQPGPVTVPVRAWMKWSMQNM